MAILTWLQAQLGAILGYIVYDVIIALYNKIGGIIAAKIQSAKDVVDRNKAVDHASAAATPDDAYNAEAGIVKNEPKP